MLCDLAKRWWHLERRELLDTKHNRVIVFPKIVAGAVTGKTFDDSIEGRLRM